MKTITLILLLLPTTLLSQWINEFHYDNVGADVNEFIEVILEGDISQYSVILYNGRNSEPYKTIQLEDFEVGDTVYEYVIYYYFTTLQNGHDGIVLTYGDSIVDNVAYEQLFNPLTFLCPAVEDGGTESWASLQLQGENGSYFWTDDEATPGYLNINQGAPYQWWNDPYWDSIAAVRQMVYDSICDANGHHWIEVGSGDFFTYSSPKISDSVVYILTDEFINKRCMVCDKDSIFHVQDSIVIWSNQ